MRKCLRCNNDLKEDYDVKVEGAAYGLKITKPGIFKENLGMSVHQYIMKKRLGQFRDAIISNEDIMEASLRCGFSDYSSFYRAFKKEYGMSPKEFKEMISRGDVKL